MKANQSIMMSNFALILSFILLLSCSNNSDNNVVAQIDGEKITMQQLDRTINEQLFHMLEGIYLLRKQALEESVNQIVISKEAKKLGITVEELISQNVQSKITDSFIEEKIKELNGFVPDRKNFTKSYDCNTEFGLEYLKESLYIELKREYANSLRNNYEIVFFLNPPEKLRPKVNLKDLEIQKKGNPHSRVNIILIADYDCEGCWMAKPIVNHLFDKYSNYIEFGYCNYGSYSLPALAAEISKDYDMFWEMHDYLFNEFSQKDTASILSFAMKLGIDKYEFRNKLSEKRYKSTLMRNAEIIQKNKIVATPTLVINNKVFNAPFLLNEIDNYVKNIISK